MFLTLTQAEQVGHKRAAHSSSSIEAEANKKVSSDFETKYWCWTYFPETEGEYVNFPSRAPDEFKSSTGTEYRITYCSYQEEKCPDTGKLHLQGYLELESKNGKKDKGIRFSVIRKCFNSRIHWEKRRGSAKQADDYTKKDETFSGGLRYSGGELSKDFAGKRNDVQDMADDIIAGMSLDQVAKEHPTTWMRLYRGAQDLANKVAAKRDYEREVYIVYGEPGSGKSSWCKEQIEAKNLSWCIPDSNNSKALSFESYEDEQALLIDDYEKGALSNMTLKNMLDRYATKLPGRGHSKLAKHTHVYITSNYPISQWFDPANSETEREAIERRATMIIYATKKTFTIVGGSMLEKCKADGTTTIPNPMAKYLNKAAPAANSEFVMAPANSGSRLGQILVPDGKGNEVPLSQLDENDFEEFSQEF